MDSNVVLVLANAEDEADEVVAAIVASGDHFWSSILLAAEATDADAVAAGRDAVIVVKAVFGSVQFCAHSAEVACGIWYVVQCNR